MVALGLIVGAAACASQNASSPSVGPNTVSQSAAPSTSQAPPSSVVAIVPVETTGPPPSARSTSTTTVERTPLSTVPSPTTTIDLVGPAYVGPLNFKWPTGCTVKVLRTTNLGLPAMELVHEYDLTLTEEDGNLVVSYGFPTLVAMDGNTPSFGSTKRAIGGPLDFAITPDGHFSGIVHTDAWLAPFSAQLKSDPTRLVADATSAVQAGYWFVPIGAWLQFDGMARQESRTDSLTLPRNPIYERRTESLPIGPLGRARLRIELSHVVDADPTPEPLPARTPGGTTAAVPSMIGRTIVNTFEAVLDPTTMRPDIATLRTEFSPPSEETNDFSRFESYAFDWKNSNCHS
jgi:hypothetical protein